MTTPQAAKPPRKRSRAAQLRAGKAAVAAASAEPTRPALPADVEAAIEAYRPRRASDHVWGLTEDVTRDLLRAYAPAKAGRTMSDKAWAIAAFTAWVATRPGRDQAGAPLSVDEVKAPGLLDAFINDTKGATPDGTRATQRTVVGRALRNLSGERRAESIAHQAAKPPYTAAQCEQLLLIARHQPTIGRRRALMAVLALGLGAGLDAGDQRAITPADIDTVNCDGTDITLITVRGTKARTAVMAAKYVPVLNEALALHREEGRGETTPLHGMKLNRHTVITPVRDRTVTATGEGIELNGSRLRNTWLVDAMSSDVPLSVLMTAAGLKSARTLADLLPYCPQPSQSQVRAVLAAIGREDMRTGTASRGEP